MPELEKMTLSDLKLLAKENNIKNISKLKKEELIEILTNLLSSQNQSNFQEKSNQTENEETASLNILNEPSIDYKLTNEGDEIVEGILDILPDGYGFLRGENYLSTAKDVYVSVVQIKRFKLDTGDMIKGISRFREGEKFPSLIFV